MYGAGSPIGVFLDFITPVIESAWLCLFMLHLCIICLCGTMCIRNTRIGLDNVQFSSVSVLRTFCNFVDSVIVHAG